MPTTNETNPEHGPGTPGANDCNCIIFCPRDPERVAQLQAKHAEYRERLYQSETDSDAGDAILLRWKRVILATLLLDGRAEYSDLKERFIAANGHGYGAGRFGKAWDVIADYVRTGGANNCGGTGLSQSPASPPTAAG